MTKGGKRQNAGAKRKGQCKRVAISLTLEEDLLEHLQHDKATTGKSCSDSVNQILRAYYAVSRPLVQTGIDLDAAEASVNAFDLELLEDELREQEERIIIQSA